MLLQHTTNSGFADYILFKKWNKSKKKILNFLWEVYTKLQLIIVSQFIPSSLISGSINGLNMNYS